VAGRIIVPKPVAGVMDGESFVIAYGDCG